MTPFFGDNKLNTKDLFDERKKYQRWAEERFKNTTKPIDLWYDHPFYGRMNNKGQIIYPSEGFLKPISQKHGQEMYAMNFVADMFNSLVDYWNGLQSSGKLVQESEFLVIEPVRGWQNVHEMYHSYMNTFYLAFSQKLRQLGRRPKSIQHMTEDVVMFLKDDRRFAVLTKSSFITSVYSTPLISGLMIDIMDHEHDLDRKKEEFINDPNFLIFKNTAQKFGFKLDENAPWRLIADIRAPNILEYLSKYELKDINDVHDEQYYKAFEFDVDNLKSYMLGFWNKLVDQKLVCGSSETIEIRKVGR